MNVKLLVHHVTVGFNSLNAELNPICHLLALVVAHHILHVSRARVESLMASLNENYKHFSGQEVSENVTDERK